MGMKFSERTRYTLANSIKELMRNIPLDKISVREIVENCGTTRQTFYRNFKDKYDLVNWYFDKIVQKTIKQMGLSLSLEEGLTKKFELIQEDKYFFMSAFSSSDLNNLFHYDYCCIYEFYKEVAIAKGPLTEEIIFLLEFYCRSSMDITADWARKGMKTPPATMARLLVEAMPPRLHDYLSDLSNYKVTT
jgi:AcrR family transcriptional regulator